MNPNVILSKMWTQNAVNMIHVHKIYMKDFASELRSHISFDHWLREFATATIVGPRGIGHTSAVRPIAALFEYPLLITPDVHGSRYLRSLGLKTLVLEQANYALRGGHREFDAVIVDNASNLNKEDVYTLLKENQFVFEDDLMLVFIG